MNKFAKIFPNIEPLLFRSKYIALLVRYAFFGKKFYQKLFSPLKLPRSTPAWPLDLSGRPTKAGYRNATNTGRIHLSVMIWAFEREISGYKGSYF